MKLAALILTAALFPIFASAAELTYQIDLDQSRMDEITAFDICGLPKEIKMDPREDLATVVIQKNLGANSRIEYIQASKGSIQGGDLEEPYMGDYRVRVGLVKTNLEYYAGGIFQRVEITTYGSKAAPKAFTVDVELLNYRESAELAEGSVCTGYAYRLR